VDKMDPLAVLECRGARNVADQREVLVPVDLTAIVRVANVRLVIVPAMAIGQNVVRWGLVLARYGVLSPVTLSPG
jgi:hypothetical protein